MSTSGAPGHPTPNTPGETRSGKPNEGDEAERQVTSASLESTLQGQNETSTDMHNAGHTPLVEMKGSNASALESSTQASPDVPPAMNPLTTTTTQEETVPSEQIEALSISNKATVQTSVSDTSASPPPPPEKDEAYVNRTGTSEWTEKELPDVPKDEKKGDTGKKRAKDDDSQPEIQSIMGQFEDATHDGTQEQIMSPRMELAEQFLGGQGHFPPRKSSLDHGMTLGINQQNPKAVTGPPLPLEKQPVTVASSFHRNSTAEEFTLTRRSSTSTLPPPPEPEPDQPFDFHRFLEQLRHRTADPVAKFLRSFLHEFGKRQWMVHEQVKIISDFLAFITNKMAICEVWRDVSDSEFDNAKEGMEKLVMNRLYHQTFSPAIPGPPSIPRSASRSKRREMERLHGPWRRGQHQEDVERDDVLAQKMRIYSWVKEEHLDIAPVSSQGRRFLNLAQQELRKLNGYRAPRDKVICILNCCKVIFGLLRNAKKSDTSADSFVPLLIYVVLQANPEHLVSNIQYILRFRNQDKLGGEAGYYLSSLSGAIQFVETLDRTSLTVSDEEFERNVEAAVSAIAEQHRASENPDPRVSLDSAPGPSRKPTDVPRDSRRTDPSQSREEDNAPVAGLLRTIQKPLSTIGRIFSDESDSPQEKPMQPISTPQSGMSRLSPNVYQPPRASGEEQRRLGERNRSRGAQPSPSRAHDAQDAAARQASAEDAEARRIQHAEHNNVVETLSNMFPNLDRDVIDDVVKMKEGRVGLAVDACLALSGSDSS
ncbi:guanine nucleotide exchange factor VPS9 [Aspergillus lucknowensis]|uniref:Guanine nucleotide exchange factor Vps9 n=1 Tax=Aspergillus lucknowensis TaxID=176173 RepID=A0ABR4LLT5_9EURO